MPKARVKWSGGMQFVGMPQSGHAVVVDADQESGGLNSAARPTELLLVAQGGCTGMDVVSILRKMKVNLSDFEMEINGERTEEDPKYVKKIHILYRIWGEVPQDKLEKAIELSLEKYCTVANTLKGRAEFSHSYEINPKRRSETD